MSRAVPTNPFVVPAVLAAAWAVLVAVVAFGVYRFSMDDPFTVGIVLGWMVVPNLFIVPFFHTREQVRLARVNG